MSRRIDIVETRFEGLSVLQRHIIGDCRGYLERLFCADELAECLSEKRIKQINHTLTKESHTVRGMHFQYPPHAEVKIVSCLRGEVFDVAVDLRPDSATFLHWHAEVLSAHNHRSLVIPEGFAHGFQTLSDECELIYFHTASYAAGAEGALNPLDPRLAIKWPAPVRGLSDRDAGHPYLDGSFLGVEI